MAKKAAEQFQGVTFTSEIIRHTNAITTSGTATTAVAEAIDTPGYSEAGYSGCFIVGAQVSPAPGTAKLVSVSDNQLAIQMQVGDRSATPALLNPDDVGFFGQLIIQTQIATSGLLLQTFPIPMPISMPVPIIVMPQFTICFDTTANVAEMQSVEIFTEIYYRTVKLADRAYTGLLLQQQRIS